jgi:hypothetical protein
MSNGQSWGGALGIGTESTYGTGEEPSLWLPINSESVKGKRNVFIPASICGSRVRQMGVPGLREASGGFQVNGDAVHMGLPLYYMNGQVTSSGLAGSIAAAPTGEGVDLGEVTGDFYYKVCAILKDVDDNHWFTNPSPVSLQVSAVEVGQIVVRWVNPTSLPSGYTQYGTAVFRTANGGLAGTEKLLAIVVGDGDAYGDFGLALTSTVVPPAALYQHTFTPAALPEAELPSFSVSKLMDNDMGERFVGCRMNSLKLAVGDAGNPVVLDWDLMARDWETITNPEPTFNCVQPFMNWQARFVVDGTVLDRVEALELTVSNGLQALPGLTGAPRIRNICAGIREVSGSMTLAFENHDYWQKVRDSEEFTGVVEMFGDPASAVSVSDPVSIRSWRYGARIDLARCKPSEAGGNLSGSERMTEQVPFVAYNDPALGYEARFILYNTTASYTS